MPPRANFLKKDACFVLIKTYEEKDASPISFEKIKEYVESCPAARDPLSRIIIEADAIYFGYGFKEIQAAFPWLPDFIMTRTDKSFSEENVLSYGYNSPDTDTKIGTPIIEQKRVLQKAAARFFASLPEGRSPSVPKTVQTMGPKDILYCLLSNNDTVVIGELHKDKSSKKLLIDNMAQLKELGVDAIYLEHVFYDTQKELFDAYLASDSLAMPALLADYLHNLDNGFHLNNREDFSPYTFTGLVVQAKRYAIRIIPIDTVASYATGSALHMEAGSDPAKRCLMMNYVAAQTYIKEKNSHRKAIFFVGSAHINKTNSKVPGITEITHGPTLVITDKNDDEKESTAEKHVTKPDVLLYMHTDLSEQAKELKNLYLPFAQKAKSFHKSPFSEIDDGISIHDSVRAQDLNELRELKSTISKMKTYGQRLLKREIQKGHKVIKLAHALKDQLQHFVENDPALNTYIEFKKNFNLKLHSIDALFKQRSKYHKSIITNIEIALTDVGSYFLMEHLVVSYNTRGKGVGFFEKPREQELIVKDSHEANRRSGQSY